MQNSEKIITLAAERLNRILPLAANQHALGISLRHLHREMLYSYVRQGRTLNREEMARYVDDLDETINTLKHNDLVVFNDNEEPIGAYPFTMEERIHEVTVNDNIVHCVCALDALAVSPMFNVPTKIASRCHVTNDSITLQQHGLEILNGADASNIYVGINWCAATESSCCGFGCG